MAALRAQSYDSFNVLIIDNGSTDGSREYLEQLERDWNAEYAAVNVEESKQNTASGDIKQNTASGLPVKDKMSSQAGIAEPTAAGDGLRSRALRNIFLDTNTGFSGAVNAGIAESDTEYVVLLNNDTKAHPDYLRELARVFEADTDRHIFAVTPKMIQMYHPELLDDAGDGYNLFGWAFQRGVGQSVAKAKFNHRTKVFSACAGAAAYRREVFDRIRFCGADDGADAYFDPMHFAYLEDMDVSFRARVLGLSIVYAPESIVYHVGSGTSGSKYNSFKVRLAARNNVYLNYKNMPLLMLLINLPGILLGVLIKYLFFVRIGFGRDYRGGFAEGLKELPECHKHKTGFKLSRLGNYIAIEMMLIRDTFSYIQDFAVRQVAKIIKI